MAAGLSRGTRASVIAAIGCTLGIVPHMVAAITGLAALLHTSAVAFQVSSTWVWLTFSLSRGERSGKRAPWPLRKKRSRAQRRMLIVSAILVNILNPKLTIFFFAFLPQFVSTNDPGALIRMVELSGVFMLITLVVFIGYGSFAAAIRKHVISRPQVLTWLRRAFAGAFVALGARLAFADR